ncbi:unnamed protein product [Calypogeia fissa]
MCITCLGRPSVEDDTDEKSSRRRHHHAVPRLNIYHNLSRWLRRRNYQRLSKVPGGRNHMRRTHHPPKARRRPQQINPRLQMVPGIHIRIISPISLLLRLRDAYSRKVSLIVTSTTKTSSSARKIKMKQQHVAEVIGKVPVRVKLPSVRELLADEAL